MMEGHSYSTLSSVLEIDACILINPLSVPTVPILEQTKHSITLSDH
jgi:hypothetical protein